jgi:hypothetical protein
MGLDRPLEAPAAASSDSSIPANRRIDSESYSESAVRIRQIEPLLQEVDAKHALQLDRRTTQSRLRIVRLDQRQQARPRDHGVHLGQKRSRRVTLPFDDHARLENVGCFIIPLGEGFSLKTGHLCRASLRPSEGVPQRNDRWRSRPMVRLTAQFYSGISPARLSARYHFGGSATPRIVGISAWRAVLPQLFAVSEAEPLCSAGMISPACEL